MHRSSLQLRRLRGQPLRVLAGGLHVVHAARADHHQQAVVRAVEDGADLARPRSTTSACSSLSGSSSSICAGVTSGTIRSMRWSRT